MESTELKTAQAMPKAGTKAFSKYKADICDLALKLKIKMNKITEQYGEVISQLEVIFSMDDKQYFSDLGMIKKEVSHSYSIAEENINKVKEILEKNNLTTDDYIVQKTSRGVTPRLRSLIKDKKSISEKLLTLVDVKTS
jgi:hypothetical protein